MYGVTSYSSHVIEVRMTSSTFWYLRLLRPEYQRYSEVHSNNVPQETRAMAAPGLASVSKLLFILQALVFKLKKITTRSKDEDPQFQQTAGLLLGISSFIPNLETAYKDEQSRIKLMAMARILAGSLEKPIYAAMNNAALVRLIWCKSSKPHN